MVTDLDGRITQNVVYIPYGEVFVEERNGSWASPYLFNAKELDEETGLYYYGARYLNPSIALWLSTDPLQGKYPGMSPYNYCAGNPVKLVDPDGKVMADGESRTLADAVVVHCNEEVNNLWNEYNNNLKNLSGRKLKKENSKILEKIHNYEQIMQDIFDLSSSDKCFKYQIIPDDNLSTIPGVWPDPQDVEDNPDNIYVIKIHFKTNKETGKRIWGSIVHESHHGGDLARGDLYGMTLNGVFSSNYSIGHEVAAYKLQTMVDGEFTYYSKSLYDSNPDLKKLSHPESYVKTQIKDYKRINESVIKDIMIFPNRTTLYNFRK
ncbi:MAG: RHS repeat-associated core domain-containing protein [Paludibacteraceae bacterium]|nr:RHS repeat-associated core domain-containing protein [Paludibacteraceae bacterium]